MSYPGSSSQQPGSGLMREASSASSNSLSIRPLNPRTLAGRRVSRYLTEPSTSGNTLVGLADGTTDVAAATADHERRIAEELAKLNAKLP